MSVNSGERSITRIGYGAVSRTSWPHRGRRRKPRHYRHRDRIVGVGLAAMPLGVDRGTSGSLAGTARTSSSSVTSRCASERPAPWQPSTAHRRSSYRPLTAKLTVSRSGIREPQWATWLDLTIPPATSTAELGEVVRPHHAHRCGGSPGSYSGRVSDRIQLAARGGASCAVLSCWRGCAEPQV